MLDVIKDLSVIYSFDRTGYERHARHFETLDPGMFLDKHFLVTGGTSGIGEALCERLLKSGAHVTLTGRNERKFNSSSLSDMSLANFVSLDMANFQHIREMVIPEIDGLVCNAGGMPENLKLVDDKYDEIFASQVIGHYLLIRRVIEEQKLKPGSPIHITSSGGMYLAKLKLDDMTWQKQPYEKVKSYANAKRAQVILNKMLAEEYPDYHFTCSHPGWVKTVGLEEALPNFVDTVGRRLRTSDEGADTIYWCLHQHKELPSGKFWFDRSERRVYPFFWTKESRSDRQRLLSMCQEAWEQFSSLSSENSSAQSH